MTAVKKLQLSPLAKAFNVEVKTWPKMTVSEGNKAWHWFQRGYALGLPTAFDLHRSARLLREAGHIEDGVGNDGEEWRVLAAKLEAAARSRT